MTDPGQGWEGAGRVNHNNFHGHSGVQVGPNGHQVNINTSPNPSTNTSPNPSTNTSTNTSTNNNTNNNTNNINVRNGAGILLSAVCVAALIGGTVFAVNSLAPWARPSQGTAPPPDSVVGRGPDATAPAQNSPSDPAAVSSPTTPPAAAGPVRWQGEIHIGPTGVDLGSLPPTQTTDDSYDAALYSSSDVLFGNRSGGPNVASWPGPGTPSRKQCADRLATHGGFMAQATKESVLCVRTRTGRIAALTITAMGDVLSGGTAKVIVWETQDSP
ncbi:hypothetical protein ACFYNZ_15020 [Streptomyces kebangsaanensis]|uniref:Serine/threonine protein kinase n=1 Tax=Streptomyces kebangsaanensis TaxID=864058 RepID=A0ABW6KSC8_9ACTN